MTTTSPLWAERPDGTREPEFDSDSTQVGFTLGGPIRRDKLFYFLAVDVQEADSTKQNDPTRIPVEVVDNVSWITGDHTVKGGVEYNFTSAFQTFRGFGNGRFIFGSTEGFLNYLDNPSYVECSDGSSSQTGVCPPGTGGRQTEILRPGGVEKGGCRDPRPALTDWATSWPPLQGSERLAVAGSLTYRTAPG